MHKYKNIDEWLDEEELGDVRRDRIQNDIWSCDSDKLFGWLKLAFELGAASAKTE